MNEVHVNLLGCDLEIKRLLIAKKINGFMAKVQILGTDQRHFIPRLFPLDQKQRAPGIRFHLTICFLLTLFLYMIVNVTIKRDSLVNKVLPALL